MVNPSVSRLKNYLLKNKNWLIPLVIVASFLLRNYYINVDVQTFALSIDAFSSVGIALGSLMMIGLGALLIFGGVTAPVGIILIIVGILIGGGLTLISTIFALFSKSIITMAGILIGGLILLKLWRK